MLTPFDAIVAMWPLWVAFALLLALGLGRNLIDMLFATSVPNARRYGVSRRRRS